MSILFFIIYLVKKSLGFRVELISCFRLLSILLVKFKRIVFGSVIITSLLSAMRAPVVTMTWLNCYKAFWWFYYAATKATLFVWFRILVCLNYFQFLFVLIILGIWLIVCLELRFLILFLRFIIVLTMLEVWLIFCLEVRFLVIFFL